MSKDRKYNEPMKVHLNNKNRPLCKQVMSFSPPNVTTVRSKVTCKTCRALNEKHTGKKKYTLNIGRR